MNPPVRDSLPEIDAMRSGVEYRFPVVCRGMTVLMRPLTSLEIVRITQQVNAEIMAKPEVERVGILTSVMLSSAKLEVATTSDVGVDNPKLSRLIIERMTHSEITYLYKQWLAGCDKCDPALEELSTDEVNLLLEEVKKNKDIRTALIDRSFLELANMCRLLMQQESPVASSSG